ncbi:hypothetical protein DFJ58DRAFT_850752 [Suillus subalutaceus]|uniref:uncharacterized protein n=1 Tax=Suillus subalutaceus TaxID=48586 RepID=UPI001B872966|nr:uncharacterized protein DFJ58DRAFT_850752 [Suillus subalutaceus]KAG1811661.1 hypothetical protein DFJ58DRAFT_850752 [Suillus subalutaceus]
MLVVTYVLQHGTMWEMLLENLLSWSGDTIHCQNDMCPLNPTINKALTCVPPAHMPADLAGMQVEEGQINSHFPHYSVRYTGILYATRAMTPHLVSVPLRAGILCLTHLSQLEVQHWVDCLGRRDRFVVATSHMRKTFNVAVGPSQQPIEYGYTFFREEPAVHGSPNRLICQVASLPSDIQEITGNILVVKHNRGHRHKLVDVRMEDVEWINGIIKKLSLLVEIILNMHMSSKPPHLTL